MILLMFLSVLGGLAFSASPQIEKHLGIPQWVTQTVSIIIPLGYALWRGFWAIMVRRQMRELVRRFEEGKD